MKTAHLIVVGKLKEKNLLEIESDYLKRVKNPSLQIHEVKSHQENLDQEAQEVISKIKAIAPDENAYVVLLAENGELMNSEKFSMWIYHKIETQNSLIFVIGGASGHGQEIQNRANARLSLSPLTYPHKLARILFVEQFYRAQTIKDRHPYHK